MWNLNETLTFCIWVLDKFMENFSVDVHWILRIKMAEWPERSGDPAHPTPYHFKSKNFRINIEWGHTILILHFVYINQTNMQLSIFWWIKHGNRLSPFDVIKTIFGSLFRSMLCSTVRRLSIQTLSVENENCLRSKLTGGGVKQPSKINQWLIIGWIFNRCARIRTVASLLFGYDNT